MTGASIQTTLELCASLLREVKARMRGLFTQQRVAASADCSWTGCWGASGADKVDARLDRLSMMTTSPSASSGREFGAARSERRPATIG